MTLADTDTKYLANTDTKFLPIPLMPKMADTLSDMRLHKAEQFH